MIFGSTKPQGTQRRTITSPESNLALTLLFIKHINLLTCFIVLLIA